MKVLKKIKAFFKKLYLIIYDTFFGPESHSENRYYK